MYGLIGTTTTTATAKIEKLKEKDCFSLNYQNNIFLKEAERKQINLRSIIVDADLLVNLSSLRFCNVQLFWNPEIGFCLISARFVSKRRSTQDN
jgi:hypothetical protein